MRITFFSTIVAGLLMATSLNTYALGQLMVSPTRIVFEGNDRTKQITLINNGAETGRFRISFVRRDMNTEGKIIAVDENQPGMYSDEMVRFSPRQVTLAPGQSQTVRLMLRKKRGTADGEYRSHMMFQALPDPAASDISTLSSDNQEKLTIQLIPVVGITIPVIVRQGKLNANVSLSDFELKQSNTVKAQPVLSLKINRNGDMSTYGDFRVHFTPKGGTPVIVGQMNGVAVYTSTTSRSLDIKLQIPGDYSLTNGELHITYLEPGKDEKTGLIAESRLAVP
jgi:P pilus assembly chaperone PapD